MRAGIPSPPRCLRDSSDNHVAWSICRGRFYFPCGVAVCCLVLLVVVVAAVVAAAVAAVAAAAGAAGAAAAAIASP